MEPWPPGQAGFFAFRPRGASIWANDCSLFAIEPIEYCSQATDFWYEELTISYVYDRSACLCNRTVTYHCFNHDMDNQPKTTNPKTISKDVQPKDAILYALGAASILYALGAASTAFVLMWFVTS